MGRHESMRERLQTLALTVCCTMWCAMTGTSHAAAQWTDHPSFTNCDKAAVVGRRVVCGNGSGLFYSDPAENYLGHLGRDNHLSATDITALLADGDHLVVGYENGDIDIVDMEEHNTVNIPELRLTDNVSLRTINEIVRSGNRYYAAFASGILEIDRKKNEIRSTWKITGSGVNVASLCVSDGHIYAGTATGIYRAPLSSSTLEDSRQWELLDAPQTAVRALCATSRGVVAAAAVDGSQTSTDIWIVEPDTTRNVQQVKNFRSLRATADGLALCRQTAIDLLDAEGRTVSTIESIANAEGKKLLTAPQVCCPSPDGGLVIADLNSGLLTCDAQGRNARAYKPDGPQSNDLTMVAANGSTLYVSGPGRNDGFNGLSRSLQLSTLRDGVWKNSTTNAARDAVIVACNPRDEDDNYISTWGYGVFSIKDRELDTNYTTGNSTLKDIFGGNGYVRTDAMAFDSKQNLYVMAPLATRPINIRTPDGKWYSNPYEALSGWHSTAGMVVTRNNNAWVYTTRMNPNVAIFNINGTPETPDDDAYLSTSAFSSDPLYAGQFSLTDAETGDDMGPQMTALAEDRNGQLWVGTTVGMLTCSNDKKIFSQGGPVFNRIKVPRNDGSGLADYLLEGLYITTIAVDGANRKWIGTQSDGVYVVSADGYETIHHFTQEESPLLSNSVKSIAIRHTDGRVFVLTNKGLQSYESDATAPVKTMKKVDVYPNPVSLSRGRGYVSIDGTEADSHVFITDVAGHRVFHDRSKGGLTRWNLTRNGGAHVQPGVYIVWATNADGSAEAVGKILVEE